MRNLMNNFVMSAILAAVVLVFPMIGVAATNTQGYRSEANNVELSKKIRKELVTLPWYGVFDNLAYEIKGDTVVLHGEVVRPTTRSDAERRVARLPGVSRVVNNTKVLPLSPFDDQIRRRTLNEISRTAGLYRYFLGGNPSIHIVVDRGHVTLEGVVANRGDANLAYIAANRVAGVFSVTNNLRTDRGRAN